MRHRSGPAGHRPLTSLCAAITAHAVVLAVLVQAVTVGSRRYRRPDASLAPLPREERVTFVSTTVTAPPSPADRRIPSKTPRRTIPARTVPPVSVPDAVEARKQSATNPAGRAHSFEPTPAPARADIITGDPSPMHTSAAVDRRLFAPSLRGVNALRSQVQLHDSVVNAAIAPVADSLNAIGRSDAARERKAWTRTTGSGAVWGIDPGGFRLGRFTLGAQMARSNDGAASNAARLRQAHDDIERMAFRTQGEAAFRKAVGELRTWNDKLHDTRQARGKTGPP